MNNFDNFLKNKNNNFLENKKVSDENDDVSTYTLHRNKKQYDDDLNLSNLYQDDFEDDYITQNNKENKRKQKVKVILSDDKSESLDKQLQNQNKATNIATSGSVFLELINSKATRKELPKKQNEKFESESLSNVENNSDITTTKNFDKKKVHDKLKFKEFENKPKSLDDYFDYEDAAQSNDYFDNKQKKSNNKENDHKKQTRQKKQNLFRNNFDLTKDYSKEVSTLKSKIDSILHVAGENGVSAHDLQRACEIDREHLKIVLNELKKQYDAEDSGIILVEFGDKFKVLTTNKNKTIVSRFVTTTQKNPLSQSVLETLAIIAYNKTASRSFIEKIRDKDPKAAIDTLLKHGLIKQAGFAKGPGRAILYTVTQTFFDKFGIQDLSDLPKLNKDIPVVEVEETE